MLGDAAAAAATAVVQLYIVFWFCSCALCNTTDRWFSNTIFCVHSHTTSYLVADRILIICFCWLLTTPRLLRDTQHTSIKMRTPAKENVPAARSPSLLKQPSARTPGASTPNGQKTGYSTPTRASKLAPSSQPATPQADLNDKGVCVCGACARTQTHIANHPHTERVRAFVRVRPAHPHETGGAVHVHEDGQTLTLHKQG